MTNERLVDDHVLESIIQASDRHGRNFPGFRYLANYVAGIITPWGEDVTLGHGHFQSCVDCAHSPVEDPGECDCRRCAASVVITVDREKGV